jgi:hypothetical protein
MGALLDTKLLLQKHPLTFLSLGAAAILVAPILSVSTSAALRPWAKRILANAFSVRREAQRIAAESKEAYADLVAEVMNEAGAEPSRRAPAPAWTPRIHEVESSEQPLA